jgi:hypothetical protein
MRYRRIADRDRRERYGAHHRPMARTTARRVGRYEEPGVFVALDANADDAFSHPFRYAS